MPRESRPPRNNARRDAFDSAIPMNDDREEKSRRLQSRQALHEMHMNQIKAAVSPVRKGKSTDERRSGSGTDSLDKENDGLEFTVVNGNAVSPAKRVPILANFEEWMKMATDNKINAANSWNFALIDYFHDMSLLKEGDGVNFQKASCTLDGCVKIYTSRVDSVATETGKLLSGLADSGNKTRKTDEGEDNDAEDDEEADGEDGTKKKTRKRVQRSSETTLVSSFAQLQLKKMELEFAVDPLFKKASADFDEGGAKGLLLNHLTIDAQGRIVFDSSDDTQESEHKAAGEEREDADGGVDEEHGGDREELQNQDDDDEVVDVAQLGARFLTNLSQLDELDICPSLKAFELGGGDDSLDIPFLKAPEDWRKQQSALEDQLRSAQEVADYDPLPGLDDDGGMDGFDAGVDVGFGEGGEAWVKHAAISTVSRPINVDPTGDGDELDPENNVRAVGVFKTDGASYGVAVDHANSNDHENILNYFDEALRKNWAGPEHWRIKKVKDSSKPTSQAPKKKEKVPFEINFAAPMTQALSDTIFTPATSNSTICLPRMQWRSKTRNLLPDDKHFNSRQLLRLFLKPKARVGAVRSINVRGVQNHQTLQDEGEMDGAFWARQQAETAAAEPGNEAVRGNYDANFFQDDGLGLPSAGPDDDDEDFADARETLSPRHDNLLQDMYGSQENAGYDVAGGFGSQLVTQSRRIRPEYVQYARIAKKVDVRRLKEEMWKGLGLDHIPPQSPHPQQQAAYEEDKIQADNPVLNFTSVMNGLQAVYPAQAMCDISTSYGFICLLHLANEQGLILKNGLNFEEISIQKDFTAEITGIE